MIPRTTDPAADPANASIEVSSVVPTGEPAGRPAADARWILVLSDSSPHNLGGAGEVADLVAGRLSDAGDEVLVLTTTPRRAEAGRRGGPGLRAPHLGPGAGAPAPAPQPAAPARGAGRRPHRRPLPPGRGARPQRPRAPLVRRPRRRPRRRRRARGADGARLPALLPDQVPLLPGRRGYRADPGALPPLPAHPARPGAQPPACTRSSPRHVATIACISRAQQTALRANGFAGLPTEVIHNGIDPAPCETTAAERDAFRREHGLEGRPLVLFGGRISGAKGGDQLIRAAAHARRRVDLNLAHPGRPAGLLRPRPAPGGRAPDCPRTGCTRPGWLDRGRPAPGARRERRLRHPLRLPRPVQPDEPAGDGAPPAGGRHVLRGDAGDRRRRRDRLPRRSLGRRRRSATASPTCCSTASGRGDGGQPAGDGSRPDFTLDRQAAAYDGPLRAPPRPARARQARPAPAGAELRPGRASSRRRGRP